MCSDVDACDRTQGRGCMYTRIGSALDVESGRKIPCHTGDSNPHQYCTWLFGKMLIAIPTELPLPQDKTAREFSPRVNSECRLSYSVHAHLVCNHTPSVHSVKGPKPLAAIPLFGHMKTQHTLRQPLKDGARLPELQGN